MHLAPHDYRPADDALGRAIALLRHLTDAMYNPALPPDVRHETGTRLVIRYIKGHWCPNVHSRQLLGE